MASLGDSATALDHFDCIILSPGPGRPSHPADMGIVLDTIRRNANMPILGVCLGHQALGYVYGNEVKLSPCGPVHGLMSSVSHNEGNGIMEQSEQQRLTCQLFQDLPQDFEVVRYHSLVVDFPETYDDLEIEPIAWCNSLKETSDSSIQSHLHKSNTNICMALRHKIYPHYGVQFHPESVGTGEAGYQLLWNFCEFSHQYKVGKDHTSEEASISKRKEAEAVVNGGRPMVNEPERMNGGLTENNDPSTPSKYRVLIHKVEKENQNTSPLPLPKQVFEALYSSRPNSFWLDSSTAEDKFNTDDAHVPGSVSGDEGCPITSNSRFSIMGSNDGPLSRKIEYFGREHNPKQRGLRVTTSSGGEEVMVDGDILSYLRLKMVEEREIVDCADMVTLDESLNGNNAADPGYTLRAMDEFGGETLQTIAGDQVPFDYRGGYVGYLGYEVRHETQCKIFEQEGGLGCGVSNYDSMLNGQAPSGTTTNPNVPTAAFLFVDRSLLYDHQTGDWYIIGVAKNSNVCGDADTDCPAETSVEDTLSWMHDMKSKIGSTGENMTTNNAMKSPTKVQSEADDDVVFVPNRSKAQYQMDISRSHEEIRNGESYELCVTNQLEAEITLPNHLKKANHESPFELYKLLREKNPAPFSAFLNFHDDEEGSREGISFSSLSICCSSPERFLSIKKAQLTPKKVNVATSLNEQPLLKRQFVVESKPIKGTAARYTGAGDDNGVEEEEHQLTPDKVNGATSLNEQPLPKRQFVVESKPIKGTAARYTGVANTNGVEKEEEPDDDESVKRIDSQIAQKLQESVKDRAENLMIVDLLRNDLGRVCEVGSVHVPKLMHIESYATVHQMVSTIRGTLDIGDSTTSKNVIDVIEACFPGGSMTGAPKQRTMEILEEIEEGVSRGPYSGSLGYISLNGCMDMNIVIRSAVLTPSNDPDDDGQTTTESWKASIGCGGAITALSNSDDEYEEMLLKSRVVRRTISDWVAQSTVERTQHLRCTDDIIVR